MPLRIPIALVVSLLCLDSTGAEDALPPSGPQTKIDFAHDVVPVLKKYCAECHIGEKAQGGFSMNSRDSFLKGGESGPSLDLKRPADSELLDRITTDDEFLRMPPEGPRPTKVEVATLRRWIELQAPWEEGLVLGTGAYEPPLKHRRPDLPAVRDGREHPIDRFVTAYFDRTERPWPAAASDAVFLRRVTLDLTGQLPTPEQLAEFEASSDPQKRSKVVRSLLADRTGYAEHWLTFWNDLLRNDYSGTGFITRGRTQITGWLYRSLRDNKPYDQMVQELIAPTEESAGFARGIKWRGDVNASQTLEMQFSQSISQSLLGINMKCASCHDSFINRWRLDDAYGLAAIYANAPLTIHRCDKPMERIAEPKWIFPELGDIDATRPQPERLKQLAELMTHPDNGRLTRTIVNRMWQRLFGRGLVHPVDAMHTPPWDEDLLDYLAIEFQKSGYDLTALLELICTSQIYQSAPDFAPATAPEQFRGPLPKRMTAEQFLDGLWQITGTAPAKFQAPIERAAEDAKRPARAALLRNSLLMRALGRPNRDQIVTMRPERLTTLEAITLSNDPTFQAMLSRGANLLATKFPDDHKLIGHLFRFAIAREPNGQELAAAQELLTGDTPNSRSAAVEDLLWAVLMLPEFQFNR